MTRNDRGFTMIELLVAVVILSVALVPLLGLFVQGRTVSSESWDQVTAVSLAQGKIEELKGMPFGALADEGPTPFPEPFASLCYTTGIEKVEPGLVEITVTVVSDATGEEISVLRARRGAR